MSEPTIGERLKAARESKGMSAQKAADELHLDLWVIEGLESGDYERLGPNVYVKGHLRRYAALLDLPAAPLLEGFAQQSAAAAPPAAAALRMSTAPPGAPSPSVPATAVVLIGLGALAAAFWWGVNSRGWNASRASLPPPVNSAADSAAPASAPPAAANAAEPVMAEDSSAAPAALEAAAASPAVGGPVDAGPQSRTAPAAISATPHAVAGAGQASLRLSFSADSWVDVHDAAGHRLFAGTGHANSVRTIAGEAPLSVYLGYASGVQLELNSHAVAIGRQFMAGDVARFEAGADGVLRRNVRPAPPAGPRPRT